ncbi:MAG: signal peptidase II [Candidatus Omnitrophica bacterium]|nr:signal peptidase II [Candidatus Omnitrophota bacterium]
MIVIAVASLLFLDQLTKYLAIHHLPLNQPQPLVNGVVYLTLVYNRGAAFGILKNYTLVFVLASLFAVVLIVRQLHDRSHSRLYAASLVLILSGALGNLIDRLLRGHVIDFLDFRVWPVFNVADSAITIGTAFLAYSLIFHGRNKESV